MIRVPRLKGLQAESLQILASELFVITATNHAQAGIEEVRIDAAECSNPRVIT